MIEVSTSGVHGYLGVEKRKPEGWPFLPHLHLQSLPFTEARAPLSVVFA